MAKTGYVGVGNSAHKINTMYIGINGVSHKVKSAYIGVDGKARQWYQSGLPASSLSVGSSVYLNEGGSYVEYLVVNQGLPRTDGVYDNSCDGTWLLRKSIKDIQPWNTYSNYNVYMNSSICSWLDGDFFNSFGTAERKILKQVVIPTYSGGTYVKIFLLSANEIGWTTSVSSAIPTEGARLSYFSANYSDYSNRIAYLNGSATSWYLRSPMTSSNTVVWIVRYDGVNRYTGASESPGQGIRPALILPFTATFDPTTMRLIG